MLTKVSDFFCFLMIFLCKIFRNIIALQCIQGRLLEQSGVFD